nr:MAG TPA: hypothetical protein [Caudoviricetes sp.]
MACARHKRSLAERVGVKFISINNLLQFVTLL